MKKNVFLILMGFLVSTAFGQSNNTINWQSARIKIDGKTADWGGRPRYYDSKTKLAFDMRNDSSNLYLIFQFADQMTQYKFALAGMNLFFTTQMKPTCKAKIVFSPFISELADKQHNDPDDRTGQSSLKQRYQISPQAVSAMGFAFSNGIMPTSSSLNTIIYSIGWDTVGIMAIELKIPLRELFGDAFDLGNISQKEISLKVVENAPENSGFAAAGSSTRSDNHGEGSGLGLDSPLGGSGNGNLNQSLVTGQSETLTSGETQYGTAEMYSQSELYTVVTLKQNFKINAKAK
jgi:hypothetical protein